MHSCNAPKAVSLSQTGGWSDVFLWPLTPICLVGGRMNEVLVLVLLTYSSSSH